MEIAYRWFVGILSGIGLGFASLFSLVAMDMSMEYNALAYVDIGYCVPAAVEILLWVAADLYLRKRAPTYLKTTSIVYIVFMIVELIIIGVPSVVHEQGSFPMLCRILCALVYLLPLRWRFL